ncbi:MAG: cytochrome c oxidase subunit [Solirubrobacteraceae bacterium]|jgi:cytochrome c oxidase subunit 2|nr:cytochrome c oxidase subunit [Solirubrobacteraceae bacterium]
MTGGGVPPVREARAPVAQMLGIGAIASALGVALALLIDWFPTSASEQAGPIDTLWYVLLAVSVPVFVLVVTIVLYSVIRFRMRPGEELADGPPIHGNTRLEVIWTAIPAIVLVALCSYAYVVLTDVEKAQANTMNVRVVGEQFTWTFHYRDPAGKEIVSNQLYVPQGRPINFTVQSKDVLHDFWVPAFRMKIDAVRGVDTHVRATPNRLGEYPVVCAELCGLGHAAMRQTAHVVAPAEFDRWLTDQASKAAGGGGSAGAGGATAAAPANGKALFTGDAGCNKCHTLADAGATATIGPDLDKVVPDLSKADIQESIVAPDAKITPGYSPGVMPQNFQETLGADGVKAVVNYLAEVSGR